MSKTTIAYFSTCLLVLLFHIGCTKVISIQLHDTATQIVIEGVVNNGRNEAYVKITKSANFNQTSIFPEVHNATVIITDSNRHRADTLTEIRGQNGQSMYVAQHVYGSIGNTYQLTVIADGQIFKASSTMPDSVTLEGVELYSDNNYMDTSTNFSIVPQFTDKKDIRNYYRFIQYINHKKDPGINVFNDNIGDGLPNVRPIFTEDIDIKVNDTVKLVMLNIDANVYNYFYQLMQNANSMSLTPANPTSNISGGALGYFSAQYKQESVIVISKKG